uniref:EKC/KEOPS complex subunit TPRKB n=1 Tax=Paramormyrops kingsleyae TaxID=1676925 RepID=A0A3B3SXI9_9TELE|nr:EKC/KEOPS complex subunit TPRKB isoform X1 [Paramormyrops kingsleyae]
MEMQLTQQLELFPDSVVTQCLFKDVKNAAELRKAAIGGEISCALINPSMVVGPFQVQIAANKALHLQRVGKMKTRSLYSEVIFNLCPTNNISEAFKKFGTSDSDSAVLIALIHTEEDSHNIDAICAKVDGQQIPVEHLATISDIPKVKKVYKVTPAEEACGSLLDAVVCRMAVKDVL